MAVVKIIPNKKTPKDNLKYITDPEKTLDGELIVGDKKAILNKGKVLIAAANPDLMENYIQKDDIVILGNR